MNGVITQSQILSVLKSFHKMNPFQALMARSSLPSVSAEDSAAAVDQASSASSGYGTGYGAQFAVDEECCPAVVDPITLLTILGGLAGATLVLRQLIMDNIMMAGKKRSISQSNPGINDAESKNLIPFL